MGGCLATPLVEMKRAVFLSLTCTFFSFLLLYYWSPLPPCNPCIPSDVTQGLISSIPFIFIAEFFFSKESAFVVGPFIAIVFVNLMCTVIIWKPLSRHFHSLYCWSPLSSYNLRTRIPRPSDVIERLISIIPFIYIAEISFSKESVSVVGVVIAIVSVHLMFAVTILILTSHSNKFFVFSLENFVFCMSWWISGYIHPASFLLLCTYTVIAMVLIQATKERPFKANPTELKQGKLNSIY